MPYPFHEQVGPVGAISVIDHGPECWEMSDKETWRKDAQATLGNCGSQKINRSELALYRLRS